MFFKLPTGSGVAHEPHWGTSVAKPPDSPPLFGKFLNPLLERNDPPRTSRIVCGQGYNPSA